MLNYGYRLSQVKSYPRPYKIVKLVLTVQPLPQQAVRERQGLPVHHRVLLQSSSNLTEGYKYRACRQYPASHQHSKPASRVFTDIRTFHSALMGLDQLSTACGLWYKSKTPVTLMSITVTAITPSHC